MQVLLFRDRASGFNVEAARFGPNNFLAMNTWTSEALRWVDVPNGVAELHDVVDGSTQAVQVGDWIVKEVGGRFRRVGPKRFASAYSPVRK